MKTYFYDNEVKKRNRQEKFIVYEIEHKGDIDIAERKVKTIAHRVGRKLAGGYFNEECKPYNFPANYTVIIVPYYTRTRPYDKADKFIHDLIEYESNMEYQIL
jgi:hypothetical protein